VIPDEKIATFLISASYNYINLFYIFIVGMYIIFCLFVIKQMQIN
jgi:hypothetical protein